MTHIAPEEVAQLFVELADTIVDDFDVIEFLQKATERAASLVAARAAGLLLADERGRLQLMAATNREAHMVELFAAQSVEGPCQDCFRDGAPVISVDLTTAGSRWPQFAPLAVTAGFHSVHAFPLRLRRQVIGALNLFGHDTGDLADDDARIVQALADVTTIGLLQERVIRRQEVVTERLQTALNSRIIIEQAKGVLAQIHGCTVDEAFTLLRTWCHTNHEHLGEVAYGVVTDATSFPGLTTPSATA